MNHFFIAIKEAAEAKMVRSKPFFKFYRKGKVIKKEANYTKFFKPEIVDVKDFPSISKAKRYNRTELGGQARRAV